MKKEELYIESKIDKLIICVSPSKNNLVNLGLILTKIIKKLKKINIEVN